MASGTVCPNTLGFGQSWTCTSFVHVVTLLWVHVWRRSAVPGCSLPVIYHLWLLAVSASPNGPWAMVGREVVYLCSLGLTFALSLSAPWPVEVSVSITTYCKKMFFRWGLINTLICREDKALGVSLILWSFRKTIGVGSLLRLMTRLSTGSWPAANGARYGFIWDTGYLICDTRWGARPTGWEPML